MRSIQQTRGTLLIGSTFLLAFIATIPPTWASARGFQETPSGNPAQLAAEAQSALAAGDDARAIPALEKLTKLEPGVAELHANLGTAYYFSGRFADAAGEYRQALKLKPALTNAHYFLGASLAEDGECEQAIPYLEKDFPRISDPPLKRTIGADLVQCEMQLGRTDRAADLTPALSKQFPDDPEVLYLSGHVYSELATQASQRLLETAPASYQAHQFNAEVLEMQGKLDDAVAEYRRVLSLNPHLVGIHYRLGRLLLAGEPDAAHRDEARREFVEELRIDPRNASAEYELGDMALQARQWDDAIDHFRRAAEAQPNFTEALIGLGKSLVSAGRPQDAVAPLEQAVRLDPANPNAHYQLSFAYRRVGRDQDAQKELAAYREDHDKLVKTRQAIRAGILGDITQQSESPPQ
jgi:tetratricopeptide (TPR) repeat protein